MKPRRARTGDKVLSDLVFVKCNKHMYRVQVQLKALRETQTCALAVVR